MKWRAIRSSTWLKVVLALVAGFLLTSVYWGETFPYTHDGSNHLARFANYAAALREGQWPPRFAPYINSSFGFPVFNYNYPLANILAVPGIVAGLNPERVFALLATAVLTVGLYSVYTLLRRYFLAGPSLVATILYAVSGYNATNVYFRGGIGELMAYSAVPLAALALDSWQRHSNRLNWLTAVLCLTALLLAHNVLALMGMAALGLWSLSWLIDHKDRWRPWLGLWLLSVGLSLWFWLPALAELSLVAISGNTLTSAAFEHGVYLSQLTSPWRYGFSRPGPLDGIGFGLGPAYLFIILISLSLGLNQGLIRWKNFRFWTLQNHVQRTPLILLGLLVLSFGLSLSAASPVWQAVQFLSLFQFPWRFLFLSTLLLIPIIAWALQNSTRLLKLIMLSVVLWQVSAYFNLRPVDRFHYEPEYYRQFPHTTTTRNENRPQTFTLDTLPSAQQQAVFLEGTGSVNTSLWLGSRRQYSIQVESDALLYEPTVYFPGWEVRSPEGLLEQVFTDETGGLVAYRLPAREEEYFIRSGFTGRTPARWLGEFASLGSAIMIGVYVLGQRWFKK